MQSLSKEAAGGRLFCLREPHRGFTFVELVTVLVLLSALAAVVVPRWFGTASFEIRSYRESLVHDLRYARRYASNGCPVRVTVTASNYEVRQPSAFCSTSAFPDLVTMPDGRALTGAAPAGVSTTGLPQAWTFFSDGSTDLAASTSFTLDGVGVTVHAETGTVESP